MGEVRGKETLDMLQAMNTGHAGSLSPDMATAQGYDQPAETMVLMAAELPGCHQEPDCVRAGCDDPLGRLRDGSRKVPSITEIGECRNGEVELEPLYEYDRRRDSQEKGRAHVQGKAWEQQDIARGGGKDGMKR